MAESRGRKSAAEQQVLTIVPTVGHQRPPVPADFHEASYEAKLWKSIVDENAADWFNDSDLPLLEAYCRISANHRRVSEIAYSEPFTVTGAQGGLIANPIFGVQTKLAQTMGSLTVKLRLAPSTRLTAQVAGTKGRAAASQYKANGTAGGRPWDAKQ